MQNARPSLAGRFAGEADQIVYVGVLTNIVGVLTNIVNAIVTIPEAQIATQPRLEATLYAVPVPRTRL